MKRLTVGIGMVLWAFVLLNAFLVIGCGGQLPPIIIPTPPPASPCPPTPTPPPPCPPEKVCPECPVCPPSPIPSPSPSPSPDPTPTPPPPQNEPDCKAEFVPHRTTWGFLGCTPDNDGCDGDDCTFTIAQGSKCRTDSTPTYLGKLPNWKTCECASGGPELPCAEWNDPGGPICTGGSVGRSEYPPPPRAPKPPRPNKPDSGDPGSPGYYGYQCSVPTVWTVPAGVKHVEHDGFGGEMSFPNKGRYRICASPKGRPDPELQTCKTAVVQ